MKQVVILGAARTAGGKFGGSLAPLTAPEFGAQVVREVIKRSGISPDMIEQTNFANAWQAGVGPNPARLTAVNGGVPVDAPAVSINVRCGSSIQALIFGVQAIKAEDVSTVLVGGTESTNQVPYALLKARFGYRMGKDEMVDLIHHDGFLCPLGGGLMGELTDALAKEMKITREEQDEFAADCHNKTEAAFQAGRFNDEIVPVALPQRKGDPVVFDTDERPMDTSVEKMAKLATVFKKGGTVTAGNASGINDAAAVVLVMSAEKAKDLDVPPLAKYVCNAVACVEPSIMGIGPVPATQAALKRAKMELSDIGLIEINEAFAAQYIACERDLRLDREIVNVNGSGIGIGHPVGATGVRMIVTLIHEMMKRDLNVGLASLCGGGGLGLTTIFERV